MIGRLHGQLVERGEGRVIIDCAGVGYDVAVSLPTLAALPEPPADVTLRVFTHVAEGIFALYGFASPLERELFDQLISVSSVGPSTALGILSGLPAVELASAIARADLAVLVKVRGVGKKTAERLVLELRDKCQLLCADQGAAGGSALPAATPAKRSMSAVESDVVSALVNLGFRAAEAEAATLAVELPPSAPIEARLRAALRQIRR